MIFHARFRNRLLDVMRNASRVAPVQTINYAARSFAKLQSPGTWSVPVPLCHCVREWVMVGLFRGREHHSTRFRPKGTSNCTKGSSLGFPCGVAPICDGHLNGFVSLSL
jgi:hypothetical protein